jgi:uncharacterized protein YndB with AHSA1/START domain
MAGHVSVAETEVNAKPDEVWSALTDPDSIEQYMFGSRVETDWKEGSPIVWKGEYEGKSYEDRGEILEVEPPRRLKMTHFSEMSGDDDRPENYHTVLYELEDNGQMTRVRLTQDNNKTAEAAEHSQTNWEKMLTGLKEVVERD